MAALSILNVAMALLLAPLLPGVINRTKALFAGRQGRPLLQTYFDLYKLAQKGAVYSRTTTWLFRAGPVIGLTMALAALCLTPFGGIPALAFFPGDIFLFVYCLGLGRFATILAAMDAGSSFESMGASREAMFSTLTEPALILALIALAVSSGSLSLSAMGGLSNGSGPGLYGPAFLLVAAALFIILLVENCRVPFDDPNTHLELTMIHEVMVLDHCGPDLALITYGAALKLWVFGALMLNALASWSIRPAWSAVLLALVAQLLLAVAVGVVESVMARLRLLHVPKLLTVAGTLSVVALALLWK